MTDDVRNHIQQLLTSGVIRRLKSPWASNVVLVRKKNGDLRMCIEVQGLYVWIVFIDITDNNALTYILANATLNATGH
jgi:hypothetical protein